MGQHAEASHFRTSCERMAKSRSIYMQIPSFPNSNRNWQPMSVIDPHEDVWVRGWLGVRVSVHLFSHVYKETSNEVKDEGQTHLHSSPLLVWHISSFPNAELLFLGNLIQMRKKKTKEGKGGQNMLQFPFSFKNKTKTLQCKYKCVCVTYSYHPL